MSYYSDNFQQFIDDTFNCDMSEQYHFFEQYLSGKGCILDIGFGSGRDSLYFKNKGYEVYSIDPEEKFVNRGKELGLINVLKLSAEEMNFTEKFDGIWACASLLHIESNKLNDVFKKCDNALKSKGIMYVSFKYGSFEGKRNGRYFTDVNEQKFSKYLKNTFLKIINLNLSTDVRPDRQEKWLNIILKKEN